QFFFGDALLTPEVDLLARRSQAFFEQSRSECGFDPPVTAVEEIVGVISMNSVGQTFLVSNRAHEPRAEAAAQHFRAEAQSLEIRIAVLDSGSSAEHDGDPGFVGH